MRVPVRARWGLQPLEARSRGLGWRAAVVRWAGAKSNTGRLFGDSTDPDFATLHPGYAGLSNRRIKCFLVLVVKAI